jgi:O-antigen/teichoic acid export membrane protein
MTSACEEVLGDKDVSLDVRGMAAMPMRVEPRRWLPTRWAAGRGVLGQGAISLADQVLASATNFLTGVIVARTCSKEGLGLFSLGMTLVLLVADLQTSLVTTPYMVYAPRLKDREHALYTGSSLIHQVGFCIITGLAFFGASCAGQYSSTLASLTPVLQALVVVGSLIMLREYARRVSFARLKFKTALFFDGFIALGQIGGLFLAARLGLLSPSSAYYVIGGTCAIALAGWLWHDRKFYMPRFGQSIADLKKNWSLGKWVFASGLLWALSMNIYPWLLAEFHGVSSTGIWAACTGVISLGNPILLGFQNLAGPKIAHRYATNGARALRALVLQMTGIIVVPMMLLSAVMFLWGDPILALLYSRQYAGNRMTAAVLALNLLVSAVAFCYSRALFAMDRASVDFVINFVALFIMLTLGLWLVRQFGPIGAACGLLTAGLTTSLVRVAFFFSATSLRSKVGIDQ